jgi:hypothetical protein
MKKTTTATAAKKSATKSTKLERVKGRIARLETTIEKYEKRRVARHEKLAALKSLLASLAKKA